MRLFCHTAKLASGILLTWKKKPSICLYILIKILKKYREILNITLSEDDSCNCVCFGVSFNWKLKLSLDHSDFDFFLVTWAIIPANSHPVLHPVRSSLCTCDCVCPFHPWAVHVLLLFLSYKWGTWSEKSGAYWPIVGRLGSKWWLPGGSLGGPDQL